jgi:hypothetical protein
VNPFTTRGDFFSRRPSFGSSITTVKKNEDLLKVQRWGSDGCFDEDTRSVTRDCEIKGADCVPEISFDPVSFNDIPPRRGCAGASDTISLDGAGFDPSITELTSENFGPCNASVSVARFGVKVSTCHTPAPRFSLSVLHSANVAEFADVTASVSV